MSKALAKKIDSLESQLTSFAGSKQSQVYGLFDANDGHVKSISYVDNVWQETTEPYTVTIPLKLEPMLTRPKRFIIVVGGRGSGKSQSIAAIEAERINTLGIKVGCFREFQNSIEDSVFSIIQNQVNRIGLEGFTYPNSSARHVNGGGAKFRGLARNPESMKSMDGFKDFWVEEAQTTSEKSLKLLTPTMRSKGGRLIFSANPGSQEDAFSKRFIMPFKEELDRNGIYEDDLHLVIVMNHSDNYWFPEELEQERQWDYDNLPRALYDHIWEGEFNDSVENAIIPAEWFDACIDAHDKLGFKAQGALIATHDPSDGGDNKGYALRHGSVFIDIQEKTDGDVNEGMDWALDNAIASHADFFAWDGDGMGAPLRRNADVALEGKKCSPVMFRGSEGPYMPEAIYQPAANTVIRQSAKIKDVFRNKRSQCYIRLQDRVYNTYRAVVHGEYCDPDEMISFSSSIKCMGKLRSEVCRLPLKPNGNGYIQIMSKPEMKKLDIPSPGLSDSVMMSLGDFIVMKKKESRAPRPRKLHR